MKFNFLSRSESKKKTFFKFYKCPRCGYIDQSKMVCPVCDKEHKRITLR